MCIREEIGTEKSLKLSFFTLGLEISLFLYCQLVSKCFNDAGILDSAPHRYPTHIQSHNYCHRVCICQGIDTEKSLKFSFIHTWSRFDCFHVLNLCQRASEMEVFWIMPHIGTPHIFGLPTTDITWVCARNRHRKNDQIVVFYTRSPHFTVFMIAKLFQWCRYFGFCPMQVPHTYSVSQLLPSRVYLPRNRNLQIAQIDVSTDVLDISLFLFSQLVPKSFNDTGILDSAPCRYRTHIRSPNYCHHKCTCEEIGTEKSLKFSFWKTQLVLGSSQARNTASIRGCGPLYCQRSFIKESLNKNQEDLRIFHFYTHVIEIRLVWYCQLVPKCFNDAGILD